MATKEQEPVRDSSLDSRYRTQDPELAKVTDKLNTPHDQHGADAARFEGEVNPKQPPDQAAKDRAAIEAFKVSEKSTKANDENKDSSNLSNPKEQVTVTEEGAKKPKRN